MSSSKSLSPDAVWLVTGCSSGLGAALASYISEAGYHLVATARNTRHLNVTSTAETALVVATAVEKFGRVDVVINNAGYGLGGDFEATADADARKLVETNLWGPVNMTKEVLRVFREVNPKGVGGTIVQVSSMGGYIGFPGNAVYHASKFGLEGFTEAVAKEMHPDWNINFMIVEPGGMTTEFSGSRMVLGARHPAYLDPSCLYNQLAAYMANPKSRDAWADPAAVARVMVDTVVHRGDKALPFRLPIGSDAWGMIKAENAAVDKELDEWRSVSQSCSSIEQLESVAFLQK